MTVGIYNPYHDTLGGGEQYVFSFASYFLGKNYKVFYYTPDISEIQRAEERFGLDLSKITVREKMNTRELDILLFYSDGSFPFSFAKKTYLVFQFPVPWVKGSTLLTSLKKTRITDVLVNSQFTKQFIDKTFSVNSTVMYPAIRLSDYAISKKENIILSVGRFTKGMNTKRQDVLINVFKQLIDEGLEGWSLVLAGGVRKADVNLVEDLQKVIHDYPIQLKINIERNNLLDLYSKATIYWHASGYQVIEAEHPEQVEHFGISTLEAMASGCIPIVYPAGGQKEIVKHEINGLWWKSVDELRSLTSSLIKDKQKTKELSQTVLQQTKDFDISELFQKLNRVFP